MPKLKWPTHADLAIIKTPTVGREEYLDYMTFQKNDRPLFTEIFGPIVGLKEEWEEQGATPAELDFSAFTYRCEAEGWVPVNAGGRHGGYPEQLLEETEEHKIWCDGLGRTMKLLKGFATLPLPLDYPVRTMDDWLKIKPWYEFSEARLAGDWQAVALRHREENRVVCVGIPGGFNEPRQLLGEEALCIGYYEQPELIHDILQTISNTAFKVLERVVAAVPIDKIEVGEDLAGKSGPLAGPSQVKEFIAPYYRRIWDLLQAHGSRLFVQDSDGDINPVIDAFLDAGVNCMYPMEPAANMDIVKLREKYGTRLAFQGGIDKHVLRRSKEEITRELEYKIPPMVRTGGCMIALDHRIPNGTPLENYRFYLSKAWEIMERESEGKPVDFVSKKEQKRIMATNNETAQYQKTAAGFVIGIHPRLHVWPSAAPDGIPDRRQLRERIQNGDAHIKAMWDRILCAARQAVDDGPIVAVPKTMSADPVRTLSRVWALGSAYHVTGDAAYADAARLQARAMAADWCEWIHPESAAGTLGFAKHSDLRTGMTVQAMGLIYDWFYDQLDAADRELITRAIRERGFARWLKDRTALTTYNSNWCPCIVGGMGVAAMATLETIPESAMIADLAAEHVPRMLEGYGPDGGCEEGAAYWDGISLLIEYLDALRTATAGRVNHLADPRLRRTCWFPLFFTMPPDGLADFADSYYLGCFRPMGFAAVAAAFRDPALQWACRQAMARGLDHAVPQTLLMYDPSVKAQPPGKDVGLSKVFRHVGWAAIRNGWGDADDRPVIAAKAGDNRHASMQHLDVGNVIVSAGGGKLLSDHGYGNGRPSWTWKYSPDAQGHFRWNDPLYSTPGHNVVVIGGRNQRLDGVGTISSYRDEGAVVVVSFNCTGAYEGARSVIRTVIHRRPDLLIVVDAVALERPEPVWLSWHVPAVPVNDQHPEESTVAACLPVVRDGLFHLESPRYRLTGMCAVVEGGEATCSAGAHRRFGLIDTFGDYKPMPNTLYPYIRTQSGSARNHLFLSAFLIRPTSMARDAAWIRIKYGLALTNGAHAVQVTMDLSRGALTVADPESGWRFQQRFSE